MSGERKIGSLVRLGHGPHRLDQMLFNESQSRVIISVRPEDAFATEAVCAAAKIPFGRLGEVGGSDLVISTEQQTLRWDVAQLHQAWYFALERATESRFEF
jgi:phosphoribosylformylglycinamidine synthase